MNFEQLKIITTLSQEKSFSKTANKLHLTTSAVSQAVSNLEKELGITIFNRSKQGTFATTQGQYIIKNSHVILQKQRDIYSYTSNKFNFPKIKLIIGSIPGVNYPLIKSIKVLQTEFPFIQVSIIEQNTTELLKSLQQEKLDFALIAFTDNIKNHNLPYDLTKVTNGSFCFAINKLSALAYNNILTYDEIIKQPLAIYQDDFILNYLSNLEAKTQKSANILFETNNLNSIMNAIKENIAISFGPDYTIINDFPEKIDHIKILSIEEDIDAISPSLWFIQTKNRSMVELGDMLLTFIKQNIKTIH
ncbi:LysR family transcriptional regulator [Clostridium uliginosum]|uniref:DNA-binding transcriptional regulator, LysR family n=1 Tax=Clostridium uliginosum TaxID=119641 RepID=A0A1I1MML3_9CLOT|nr:LysR family transcriptional regulator [Clostridium uliginosum]SFC86649.1 DNA-binding transcriptional regulator, LysR family [Clostridium uliginosum]